MIKLIFVLILFIFNVALGLKLARVHRERGKDEANERR